MPAFIVSCNVVLSKEAATAFCNEACTVLAKMLGKPESFMCVSYDTPLALTWERSDEPAAVCRLVSLGTSSPDLNRQVSAKVSELLDKHCKVAPNRYYLEFVDPPRTELGWSGRTFA